MKRAVTCFVTILLCLACSFAQSRRSTSSANIRMAPGYYFTVGMCGACAYEGWHNDAIRLLRKKGINAVMGRGYETAESTQLFAPLSVFEMKYNSAVISNAFSQISLYVGPFKSEEAAIRVLDDFPSVLAFIQRKRNRMDEYIKAPVRNSDRVRHKSGNDYDYGDGFFFFISGYRLLPAREIERTGSSAPQTGRRGFSSPMRDYTRVNIPSHIRTQHRAILQQWLSNKSDWRPATINDADGGNRELREHFMNTIKSIGKDYRNYSEAYKSHGYHPYYAVADFNRDGNEDFAAIVINEGGGNIKFALAVFNGPFNKQNPRPRFYSEEVSEDDWLFWMTRDRFGDRFVLGPPNTGHGSNVFPGILGPRGKDYVIER